MPSSGNTTTPAHPTSYRGDLTLFMAVSFAAAWAAWGVAMALGGPEESPAAFLPYLLGAFGPLIGGLVIRVRRRRRGEPVPAHAVRFRRKALLWTPLLLVLASATVLLAAQLAHVAGGPELTLENAKDVLKDAGGPAAFLFSMVIAGPLSEEPGWRGTAHPRMRASMGLYQAAAAMGVIWAVWHLPLFFIAGTVQHELGLATPSGVLFAVSSVPVAMLATHAYESAGVLASVAVHFAINTTMVLVGVKAPVAQAMILGIQAILAVALLATVRRTNRPTPPAAPAATPTAGRAADTAPKTRTEATAGA